MTIQTQTTFNFSVAPALVQATDSAIGAIVKPYVDAGYCPQYPTWNPELPNGYPPSSGSYTATKVWTDLTQAQNCASEINTWLDANPASKAYNPGPQVIQS